MHILKLSLSQRNAGQELYNKSNVTCTGEWVIHYLSKGTFSNERVDLVAVMPAFSWVHDVVVVLIIIPIVDYQSLLLPS